MGEVKFNEDQSLSPKLKLNASKSRLVFAELRLLAEILVLN